VFPPAGFPHSGIRGSQPVCGSPRLIAAYRALHRLRVPRHPPLAFSRLTTKNGQAEHAQCGALRRSTRLASRVIPPACIRSVVAEPKLSTAHRVRSRITVRFDSLSLPLHLSNSVRSADREARAVRPSFYRTRRPKFPRRGTDETSGVAASARPVRSEPRIGKQRTEREIVVMYEACDFR
jgi:hypothetical protein